MTAARGRGRLGASWLLLLLPFLGACKGTVGTPAFQSTIPPNACTSAQVALTNPDCQLTLGEWKNGYISQLQEQTWYSVNVGAVDTLSIAHIIAGYFPAGDVDGGVPDCGAIDGGFNTAVNLTMN